MKRLILKGRKLFDDDDRDDQKQPAKELTKSLLGEMADDDDGQKLPDRDLASRPGKLKDPPTSPVSRHPSHAEDNEDTTPFKMPAMG